MSTWPLSTKIALGLLGAGALGLVAVLAKFWGTNPEYADRFLIVLGAGWVAWQRRADVASLTLRPFAGGWPLLLLGATAYPIGWFLQAQVAPKPVVIWWLALAWIAAAAGFLLILGGRAHLRRLAFPLLFLLFACPIPNRVLVPLQDKLQRATTTVAAAALPLLGIPVEREGFILRLDGGDLGVAEACSGVRSVTALTALAAFVACLKNFGPGRGLLLLALSVPVIAAVNAFRVVLSGLIQEAVGAEYIQGDWHEALGIGMVFVGLGMVLLVAGLLEPKESASELGSENEEINEAPATVAAFRVPRLVCVVLALAFAGTVASQFLGRKVVQAVVASAPLEQLPLKIDQWTGQDIEIPHYVTELLTYDKAICRKYRNELGDEVDVWVIYWSSQSMVKGYHHPDICLKNRGFVVKERERSPMACTGGGEVALTVREFVLGSDKNQRQLVIYWTQEGRHVWTERDEESAQLTGDSHRWLSDRLFDEPESQETGRFVVLVGTNLRGDGAWTKKETLQFTRSLADSLYALCPWAKPE